MERLTAVAATPAVLNKWLAHTDRETFYVALARKYGKSGQEIYTHGQDTFYGILARR